MTEKWTAGEIAAAKAIFLGLFPREEHVWELNYSLRIRYAKIARKAIEEYERCQAMRGSLEKL